VQIRESFHRPQALSREPRRLPAALYNLAFRLRHRAGGSHLFVPIRSMQYLAVLDEEEFIFVDGIGRRVIELAWRAFRPFDRNALSDPVPYELVYYLPGAADTMLRLQSEFARALELLARRGSGGPAGASSPVVPLKKP